MMTTIDEMKKLCDEATQGPWKAEKGVEVSDDMRCGVLAMRDDCGYLIVTIENGAPGDTCETEYTNAQLIAESRTFVPEAIRVMEQMAEALQIHFALLPDAEDYMRKALAAFDALGVE